MVEILGLVALLILFFTLSKIWSDQEREEQRKEESYTIDEVMAAADAALVDMGEIRKEAAKRADL